MMLKPVKSDMSVSVNVGYCGLQLLNERCSRELEQMQQKNSKLQQDCEQVSADKERLSLDNLQNTNELKVNTHKHTSASQCVWNIMIPSPQDNTTNPVSRGFIKRS